MGDRPGFDTSYLLGRPTTQPAFKMSTEPTKNHRVSDPASDRLDPIISESTRAYLGSLLANAYAAEKADLDTATRFAELIGKLDAAFERVNDRNDAVFRQLLVTVLPVLRRFALSLIHSPTAADDLVQDTLLRAWKNRTQFHSGTNFEAWTFTILRNQFYSDYRRKREIQDSDGVHAERLISLPEQAGRLDIQDVQGALSQLTPAMREALMLVTVEDLSYDEAAAVMGCRVGTAKSRVWRAREQLVRLLGYDGTEIGSDPTMLSAQVTPKKVRV